MTDEYIEVSDATTGSTSTDTGGAAVHTAAAPEPTPVETEAEEDASKVLTLVVIPDDESASLHADTRKVNKGVTDVRCFVDVLYLYRVCAPSPLSSPRLTHPHRAVVSRLRLRVGVL